MTYEVTVSIDLAAPLLKSSGLIMTIYLATPICRDLVVRETLGGRDTLSH